MVQGLVLMHNLLFFTTLNYFDSDVDANCTLIQKMIFWTQNAFNCFGFSDKCTFRECLRVRVIIRFFENVVCGIRGNEVVFWDNSEVMDVSYAEQFSVYNKSD